MKQIFLSNQQWIMIDSFINASNVRHKDFHFAQRILSERKAMLFLLTIVRLYSQRRIMVALRDGKDKSLKTRRCRATLVWRWCSIARDVTNYSSIISSPMTCSVGDKIWKAFTRRDLISKRVSGRLNSNEMETRLLARL